LILSGGYNLERAEIDLNNGLGDLISFGRPFINNPDLVERLRNNWPLSENLDSSLFYTPGEKGYTDYPVYEG
jgi:N-ethylmaleimide reductase